ncbi:Uma2 family endonuclease [Nocardiopsis lucentensis]|uniref:Uma2 family endonuclease n=1 Tax=Nocardiopsis lucentensis TaxID=53441 RepID=UPI000368AEBA|nr:Uma2 family endonuclease [Nocardiopsis lucentensis]
MLLLPMPPTDGFTADDLDRLPGLPRYTELIDGSLVLRRPQGRWHSAVKTLLSRQMDAQIPGDLYVYREFTVRLGERQRPEPDLMLVRGDGRTGPDSTWIGPEPVLLVVEVVTPESEIRDRERKPRIYAQAGVPHLWRVEREENRTIAVHVYALDPVTRCYMSAGVSRGRLRVDAPCPLDIDLTRPER